MSKTSEQVNTIPCHLTLIVLKQSRETRESCRIDNDCGWKKDSSVSGLGFKSLETRETIQDPKCELLFAGRVQDKLSPLQNRPDRLPRLRGVAAEALNAASYR